MRSEFSCHDPHPAALRRDSVRGSLRKLAPVWSREAGTICGLAAKHQTLPPVSSNVATGNSSFPIYKCGISSKPEDIRVKIGRHWPTWIDLNRPYNATDSIPNCHWGHSKLPFSWVPGLSENRLYMAIHPKNSIVPWAKWMKMIIVLFWGSPFFDKTSEDHGAPRARVGIDIAEIRCGQVRFLTG